VRDQGGRVEVVDDGRGVLLQPRGERHELEAGTRPTLNSSSYTSILGDL